MQPTADPAGLLEEAAAQGARLSETLDSWQVAPLQGEGPELMEPVEAMTLF